MKNTFKYVYFAGLLLAVLAAFVPFLQASWMSLILGLIGILVGIFYFDSGDVVHFGIRYLLFGAVYGALTAFPFIGGYLTTIFGAVFMFLGPVALTLLVMYFVNTYFMAAPKPAAKKK